MELIQEDSSAAITPLSEPFIESIALVRRRLGFQFQAQRFGNHVLYWVYDFQLANA